MSTVSCTVSLLIEIRSVEVKSVMWHPYLDLWKFVYSLGLLAIDEMDPVLSALYLTCVYVIFVCFCVWYSVCFLCGSLGV